MALEGTLHASAFQLADRGIAVGNSGAVRCFVGAVITPLSMCAG